MTSQRKFPIPYDYFKAIVALFLLLLIVWAWRNSGPAPSIDVAVDPSGVVTLSGDAKPGTVAALTLRNPDGSLETITALADDAGRWLISKRLPPGNYEAVVGSGGKKSQPRGFEVPKSAALSEITIQQSTADPRRISGGATPNSRLLLIVDGVESTQIQVGPNGLWQHRLQVPPGNHTVQLAYAGSPEITSTTMTLDLPPHAAPVPDIADVRVNNGTVRLSGNSSPGTVVYIWVDRKPLKAVTASADGSWAASLDLTTGEHEIFVSNNQDGSKPSSPVRVTAGPVTTSGGFAYIVKDGDWLTKLAREYLGNESLYQEIREATNAKASVDPSFATIEDDNLIYPGDKIWIPSR